MNTVEKLKKLKALCQKRRRAEYLLDMDLYIGNPRSEKPAWCNTPMCLLGHLACSKFGQEIGFEVTNKDEERKVLFRDLDLNRHPGHWLLSEALGIDKETACLMVYESGYEEAVEEQREITWDDVIDKLTKVIKQYEHIEG